MQEKVRKLFESRSKAEDELRRIQQKIDDAVENKDRRVRVERLVSSCDEAMTKLFSKHELLFDLATKTEDPSLVKHDLETWLSEVTTQNDMILKKAREYIDQCPSVDRASQPSTTATSKNKQPSKTSSAKTSRQSRTSSQRQKDLLIAKQRREEIEKQNEAALRIAKQQQELELERLQQEQEQLRLRADRLKKEQALRVEELQEENRKKLAEATLTELELREDLSDSQPNLEETLSQLSVSSKADDTARVNDWVNNSPIVTEPAPTNAMSVALPPTEQFVLPATTTNSVVNLVTGFTNVHTTTAPVASTSYNAPAMQLQNNTDPQPTMAAAHLPVNPPVTSTPMTNVTAPPTVPTVMVQSQPLTVPASHVLPNLSAWTFPTATNNAPTSVIPVTTSFQLTPTLSTVVPTTTGYPTSTPVIPVTAGGTVYYLSPSSLATVTMLLVHHFRPSLLFHQPHCHFHRLQQSPLHNHRRAVSQFKIWHNCYCHRKRTISLNGNWLSTVEIHFNGTSGSASLRVPSTQRL